jgi:hypothetical protein
VHDARDVAGGRAGEDGDGLDRHGAQRKWKASRATAYR